MTSLSGCNASSNKREAQWPKAKCVFPAVAVIVIFAGLLVVACSRRAGQPTAQQQSGAGNSETDISNDHAKPISSVAGPPGNLPLRTLTDIPLTGGATRLD